MKEEGAAENTSVEAIPSAVREPQAGGRVFAVVGLAGLLAAVVAAVTTYRSMQPVGTAIEIVFADGGGVAEGTSLRHRGVVVGEVTEVALQSDLDGVRVAALLRPDAHAVASAGTRFWVVRPEASLRGVSGLETVLSGPYIAVDPSRRQDKPAARFEGLAAPPVTKLPGDSLEIILEADDLQGLQAGAPVLFRGLAVGSVQHVALSPDSRSVRVAASIDGEYRGLLRSNTRFWNSSGVKLGMGLRGVAFEAGPLSSIALGGVQFATPQPAGDGVSIGHRYELLPSAPEDWQEWDAVVPTGAAAAVGLDAVPTLLPAELQWETSFYGFSRSKRAGGLVLPLADGTVIGPADLFQPPDAAEEGSATLQLAGGAIELPLASLQVGPPRVAYVRLPEPAKLPPGLPSWPIEKLRKLDIAALEPQEILLLCQADGHAVPVEVSQLRRETDRLVIADASAMPLPLHGAAVLRAADRTIIGMVTYFPAEEQYAVVGVK